MAIWRRKPRSKVFIHSDQGSQFTSHEWQKFLKANNLEASMSRRGNCYGNAVAESFYQLLKRERIRRKTYATRKEARQDVFDYIDGDETIWERDPVQQLANDKAMSGYRHYGFWSCMDTLREKNILEELWNSGDAPWKVW